MERRNFYIFPILTVIILFIFPFDSISQTVPELDPRRAIYARVDSFTALSIADPDTVFVDDASGFAIEDTVVYFQTLGATETDGDPSVESIFYTGKYGIMKIEEIIGDSVVVFNSKLPFMFWQAVGRVNKMQPGEVAQIVKIPTYEDVRVTDKFVNDSEYWDWDPASETGGVFAIIAGKLILETDFSADGQGFKGAEPDGEYGGVCSSASGDVIYETVGNFTESADSSGRKGESYNVRRFPYTKGFNNIATGGGGGNGKYSGGGGGANLGKGSKGGYESEDCGTDINIGGAGGWPHSFESENTTSFTYNRIYLGGGGGTGTQNPGAGRNATPGGDGGGILIILADSIIGNGNIISANGESVTALATAGAGGGGGGGVILVDAGYVENTSFEATGGNGGDVSPSFERTGPGGAGGGGLIAYNNDILLPFPKNVSRGENGEYNGTTYNGGEIAGNGVSRNDVTVPIMGFIINPLSDDQFICENEIPAKFNAAKPKGGDGTYTYQWLKSEYINPDSFQVITGATEMTYQHPDPLTTTTYFKRRVSSGSVSDESFFITVEVTPAINNNTISADQTICQSLVPSAITGIDEPVLSGGIGSGSYSFSWQSRQDNGNWSDIEGETSTGYAPGALNDTTYFRRIVTSGVCTDFSDSLSIIVLPSISGNNPVSPQDVYCNNQEISPINAVNISGGDGSYTYQWVTKTGSGDWAADVTTQEYPAVTLPSDGSSIQTYDFKRIVYSGPSNTCEDTSATVSLTVLPDIVNNQIDVEQDTICSGLPTITLNGSAPSGGDGIPFTYSWETSPDGTGSWSGGPGTNDQSDYQPGSLSETIFFRRIVTDGTNGVCENTSNVQKISVLPSISGNVIADDQQQCEGEIPETLTGGSPAGGNGMYSYQWQQKTGDEGSWEDISGTSDNFSPPQLNVPDDYFYRRIVLSGENNTCIDTSSEISIFVEEQISGNIADNVDIEECFNSELTIGASPALGGDGLVPLYTWQDSIAGGDWSNAAGNFNAEDYTIQTLNQPIWLRRVASSQSGLCSSVTDNIRVDTLTLPFLNQLTSSDDTICDDTPFSLYMDFGSNFYGPFDVEYTNGSETETITGVTDSIHFDQYNRPFEGFNFKILSVTDANDCMATGDFSNEIPLWVNDAPSPSIIKPSDPYEFCGPVFQLTSDPDENPGVSEGWWETSGSSQLTISDNSAPTAEFSLDTPFNTYTDTVYFKQTTAKCGTRADQVVVNMYEQPETPLIYRGEKATIFIIDQDTLSASAPTAGNFEWSLQTENANLEDATDNPVLLKDIPLEEETILRYTVRNGVCESRSAEIIIDRREVHVYEGISPENQDGLNDYLIAEGLDIEGVTFTFQLFANNGMLVREITDADLADEGFETGLPNNGLELWDGKDNNGNNYVPYGTYYYVLTLEFKGVEFVSKGFVLVR